MMAFRWLRDRWWRTERHSQEQGYWDKVTQECERDENCRKMRAAAEELGREFQSSMSAAFPRRHRGCRRTCS